MTLTADEAVLREVVGTDTLIRGRDYARRGAVVNPGWRALSGGRIFGQVQGSKRAPYTAIAVVDKAADGALASFRGSCTCPVGTDCKHAVALVLTALRDDVPEPAQPATAAWERSLGPLVRHDEPDVSTGPAIALQFELIVSTGRGQKAPCVGVRPVLPGKKGGWIRTGISWANLSYISYSNPRITPAQLTLLGEILTMDSGRYGNPGNTIFLESIASRRIWDVLAEARSLDIPLVHPGKHSPPVMLHSEPAELRLELARTDGKLLVQPRVIAGDERPVRATSLLLGQPAHGIAWWQAAESTVPEPRNGLRLARFAAPVDKALGGLLQQGRLEIPATDESRFFAGYLPALRARVPVIAADESVVLPEVQPPALTLTVQHLDGHRMTVGWQWQYVLGETARSEPLWPHRGHSGGRDPRAEGAIVQGVTSIVGTMPALYDSTLDGARLAPTATLEGIDTVRFSAELLPLLAELPDLTVDSDGIAPTYREAETAPLVTISGSESSDARDWFDLSVSVTVDGEEVPFEQLFISLSTGGSHLILPTGTYFSVDRPEFRELAELISEARALQDSPSHTLRVSRFQTSLWDDLDRLGVISGQAAQWQQSARALANIADIAETPMPPGLQATLRPYQRDGFNWLAFLFENRLGGVLADEMGLGKTLQALALICHAKAPKPFLVVAPTSVVSNWVSECHRFAPELSVQAITETRTRRGSDLASVAADADVVITSYTLFRLEYEAYEAQEWAGLVLDEAQFVKNHQSQSYHCVKKLPTQFKLAITGTPMENNLMELWSLLSIAAPGLFPSPTRFEKYYRTPIEKDQDVARLAQLRRRAKPLMLRRAKSEVLSELPDKQEQIIELTLNAKHRRSYQTYLHRERQKVLGLLDNLDKNRFEIFRSLTLLRQASLDVSLIDPANATIPSTKLDMMMDLLTGAAGDGHRTLVFSQFTRFLNAARGRLEAAGVRCCYLDGSTRDRGKVLSEFKNGTAPVFLISLKAGGFGLNLTEADYCMLLDPWWNPATEAQAVDRVHRIGQTKKVMVYRLVAKDTIEEKVMALKASKAALFGSVMNDGEFSSGALTASDIRGMLE